MQRDPFGCTRRLLRPLAATLASPCLALARTLARSPACLPVPPAVILRNYSSLLRHWQWQLQLEPTHHTGSSSAQHPVKALSPALLLPKPLSRPASLRLALPFPLPSLRLHLTPLLRQSFLRSECFGRSVPAAQPTPPLHLPSASSPACLDPWHCPPRRPSSLARLCLLLHPD